MGKVVLTILISIVAGIIEGLILSVFLAFIDYYRYKKKLINKMYEEQQKLREPTNYIPTITKANVEANIELINFLIKMSEI